MWIELWFLGINLQNANIIESSFAVANEKQAHVKYLAYGIPFTAIINI